MVMKKTLFLFMIVLFLAGASSVNAAGKFSLGGFAGINIPVMQEDVGNGTLFGAKGRVILMPFLGVEPNFVFSKNGDKDIKDDGGNVLGTREGGKVTSFGVDAVLGSFSGFSKATFYGLVGVNSNTLKKEGIPDQTRMGISFGTGVEFLPTEVFGVEVRARVHSISLEGGGGRNNLELTVGLNYHFGPM
jgi:hypothetical protein